jgi:hypothetical protein
MSALNIGGISIKNKINRGVCVNWFDFTWRGWDVFLKLRSKPQLSELNAKNRALIGLDSLKSLQAN